MPRLKAGLKLHEEAEKKEVEQGIHLLEDPEGIGAGGFGRKSCLNDCLCPQLLARRSEQLRSRGRQLPRPRQWKWRLQNKVTDIQTSFYPIKNIYLCRE